MATVTLDNITKQYPNGAIAVRGLNLDIDDGEFVVLVGPSGCGKSTALRMVAGLEDISDGTLTIGGSVVNDVAPRNRDIAMVFQNYALYPHMSVGKNMAYPLKIAGMGSSEIEQRVTKAAETLQLGEFLDRKPGQLSGGQRQRVAMGRAIVREPSVFLMDEPLSNLDAKLRVYMRSEIGRIHSSLKTTTIYVTHDQVEAMTMGDRVVVLKDGLLQQFDTPRNLYNNPANLFVAGFIGSPAMNVFETTVTVEDEQVRLNVGSQTITSDQDLLNKRPEFAAHDGRRLIAGIRPENLHDATLRSGDEPTITGTAELVEALGSEVICHMDVGITAVDTGDPDREDVHAGQPTLMIGSLHGLSTVQAGDQVEIAVEMDRLHFFDPQTGEVV
ncbi:ABC transporter ATP-binding protein [Euzebya tangerina]|uniref:ABC transporter ATP-binding protein n=1 Tax=Euzebya tangerina TaxID=591198 RepID=UPI000E31D8E6|nr:sn-glycerol-3-phosphate ABC transporter ATP-binding protein UgpC [Euzebya tangerina]